MTVRDLLTALQALPRDAELLAFGASCDFCWGVGVIADAWIAILLLNSPYRYVINVHNTRCGRWFSSCRCGHGAGSHKDSREASSILVADHGGRGTQAERIGPSVQGGWAHKRWAPWLCLVAWATEEHTNRSVHHGRHRCWLLSLAASLVGAAWGVAQLVRPSRCPIAAVGPISADNQPALNEDQPHQVAA
jgi:hypothetical protein